MLEAYIVQHLLPFCRSPGPLLLACTLQAQCTALSGVESEVQALAAQLAMLEGSAAARHQLEAQLVEMVAHEAAITRAKAQVGYLFQLLQVSNFPV